MEIPDSLVQSQTTGMSKVTLMHLEPLVSLKKVHQLRHLFVQAPGCKREAILLDLGIV